MNTSLLTWALGLISAFLAVKWQTSAKENQDLKQKLNAEKENLYTDFIKLYMGFVNNAEKDPEQSQKKLRALNERMLLIASNKVFLTYGDLMQCFYKEEGQTATEGMRLLGELILSMREDLGHKDWKNNLYWFDSLRPWLKDVQKFIPEKYKGKDVITTEMFKICCLDSRLRGNDTNRLTLAKEYHSRPDLY